MAQPLAVFLSHSSTDKLLARRLGRDLNGAGVDVWLDQWQIGVGDAFEQIVERGVDESDLLLVLLTPASVETGWVDREWRRKLEEETETGRARIIPVRGEPCEMPDFLAQRSWADITGGGYPLGLQHLLDLIHYHAGRPARQPEQTADDEDQDLPPLIPVVVPITVEVGAGLIPFCEPGVDGLSELLDKRLPAMRERLHRHLGFPFPGVRVVGNTTDMPPFAALILIDEVPELMLDIQAGHPMFDATPEQADLEPPDPTHHLVAELEAVLSRMAAHFLDIDTARRLVDGLPADGRELAERSIPAFMAWGDFTELLQGLVEEQVPIHDLASILDVIASQGSTHCPLETLIEYARHALRGPITERLLGGKDRLEVHPLHPELERLMLDGLVETQTGFYLRLAPEDTQAILAACRSVLSAAGGADAAGVILVQGFEIRAYLRRLIELEFPSVSVVSSQDLLPDVSIHRLAEIGATDGARS